MTTLRSIDLRVDVTEAAGLGEPAHVALTVTVPDELAPEPVVCFGKPGGGYARGYYTVDLPGPAGRRAGRLARGAGVDLRLGRPPRRRRQLPARSRAALVHPGRGGESGRRSRRAAEAGGGHPDRRAPEGRAPPDDRHRAVDGWLPHGRATGPVPLLRRHRGARLQRAAHAPADGAGHAAPRHAVGAPRRPAVRRHLHQRPRAGRARPGGGARGRRHGLGLPLRRRRSRRRAARPRGLPRPWWRPAAVGIGHRPGDGRHVVPHARRGAAGGGGDPLPRPRGPGRARRAGGPSGGAAGVRVVPERGPLRLPENGTHAQLRRDARAVLAAHRDVGGLGAGGGRRGHDRPRPRRGPPFPADPRAGRP